MCLNPKAPPACPTPGRGRKEGITIPTLGVPQKCPLSQNQAVPFLFNDHPVRVMTGQDCEPLFVAKDVAVTLGISWFGTKTIQHVPDDWRVVGSVPTSFGTKDTLFLSEHGLYFFLGKSDKRQGAALPVPDCRRGCPGHPKLGGYLTPQAENKDLSFVFHGKAVRVARGKDGQARFVAKDVCTILGYSNGPDAVRSICKPRNCSNIAQGYLWKSRPGAC